MLRSSTLHLIFILSLRFWLLTMHFSSLGIIDHHWPPLQLMTIRKSSKAQILLNMHLAAPTTNVVGGTAKVSIDYDYSNSSWLHCPNPCSQGNWGKASKSNCLDAKFVHPRLLPTCAVSRIRKLSKGWRVFLLTGGSLTWNYSYNSKNGQIKTFPPAKKTAKKTEQTMTLGPFYAMVGLFWVCKFHGTTFYLTISHQPPGWRLQNYQGALSWTIQVRLL